MTNLQGPIQNYRQRNSMPILEHFFVTYRCNLQCKCYIKCTYLFIIDTHLSFSSQEHTLDSFTEAIYLLKHHQSQIKAGIVLVNEKSRFWPCLSPNQSRDPGTHHRFTICKRRYNKFSIPLYIPVQVRCQNLFLATASMAKARSISNT